MPPKLSAELQLPWSILSFAGRLWFQLRDMISVIHITRDVLID